MEGSDTSGDSDERDEGKHEGVREEDEDEEEDDTVLVRSWQARTTFALLQTFHANTLPALSHLAAILPSGSDASLLDGALRQQQVRVQAQLTPCVATCLHSRLARVAALIRRAVWRWCASPYAMGGLTYLAGSYRRQRVARSIVVSPMNIPTMSFVTLFDARRGMDG